MTSALVAFVGLLGTAPAWAEGIELHVVVDDSGPRSLTAPRVLVAGVSGFDLADGGQTPTDEPGDHIWSGLGLVAPGPSVEVRVYDGALELGGFVLPLPNSGSARLDVRTTGTEPKLVLRGDQLAVELPTLAGSPPEPAADAMRIRFFVDDRAVELLTAPKLWVAGEPEAAVLRDDGSVVDDVAADGIWAVALETRRTEHLSLTVWEGGARMGEVTVFLPSSSEAVVRLKTSEVEPAIVLAEEAQSLGAVSSPQSGVSATRDRLAHVLWVVLVLFAMAFAYARVAVRTAWEREARPVLRRLDRWLDEQERRGPSRDEGEAD